jgi:Family of unknown function (DUF6247)
VTRQEDPEDPGVILRDLLPLWHAQFLSEYRAALAAASEVPQWRRLREVLHSWRLRAAAYGDPEFERSAQAARDAAAEDLVPVPGWDYQR